MTEPELRVQITKRADGVVILRGVRADGSVTWQRQEKKQAQFFPFHDLAHFGVETTLGFREGFYGLIAAGWDISETDGKGARGSLPREAVFVEHVVGLISNERIGGAKPLAAAEFNAQLRARLDEATTGGREFSDEELRATRARIAALHEQWAYLPPDATLDLPFTRQRARDDEHRHATPLARQQ